VFTTLFIVKLITDKGVSVMLIRAYPLAREVQHSVRTTPDMRYGLAIILSVSLLIGTSATAQEKRQPEQKKAAAASLTGCIDQQDGQYVLINEQTRSAIANLEAEGFPAEGFAKHLGHKVTVRGTSNTGGTERPIFKVRSVETISESCGP